MKTKNQKLKTVFFLLICFCLFVSPAFSAIYHIDPEANDGGNGSSASPFNSWLDLPRLMKTSDQVYFKCNTVYTPLNTISINWEGTDNNPAVVGAYYIENDQTVYGVKGKRPIISGNNYRVPENSYFGTRNTWNGLIQFDSKNYVHIKDLHIYKSGWDGIRITGDLINATSSAHFLVKNVKVEGAYQGGIVVPTNRYNYGVIEDCDISGAGYGWYIGGMDDWPVSLVVAQCPYSYTTIRRNYVHENWGEGIGSIRVPATEITNDSGYVTIEDNVVWNNRRVDIYVDRTQNNIIRRNVLVGAGEAYLGDFDGTAFLGGRLWNQWGVWINIESRNHDNVLLNVDNNLIYNNLIAGHAVGIGLASDFDSGTVNNVKFYNNTLMSNYQNMSINGNLYGYNLNDVEFRNNISYCASGDSCRDSNTPQSWWASKISWSNNAWTFMPNYISNSSDVKINANFVKTTGWQNLNYLPAINSFEMTSGNSAIGKGAVLGDDYKKVIDTDNSNFFTFIGSGISVSTVDRSPEIWDMGALIYGNQDSSDQADLLPPKIISVESVN